MELLPTAAVKALMQAGTLIIDTRPRDLFCEGFLSNSRYVPFADDFAQRFHQVVEDNQEVLVVVAENNLTAVAKALRASGFTRIAGFYSGDYTSWRDAGLSTDLLIGIEADEFAMDYQFDEFYLIDIRPAEAYAQEHAEDAENIELTDLEQLLTDFDTSETYYLYGNTPAEAVSAGAILKANGFQRVRVVNAELNAIKQTNIPWFVQKKKTDAPSNKISDN